MTMHTCKMTLALACALSFLCSCASHGGSKGAESPCISEDCLNQIVNDFSAKDAEKYFFIRRAINRGFSLNDSSSRFRENYAALATFVGEYDEAKSIYPLKQEAERNPTKTGFIYALPANATVRALARGTRAVFVNEAHAIPRSRAAIYTLLQPLREEGYTYLAIEGLTVMASDENACSDAMIFDEGLSGRGYPLRKTGFYVREPIFGEVVREALRLGFKIVAYETSDTSYNSIGEREQRLAQNLACVFKNNPDARVLTIAGFGHIAESSSTGAADGMMAARFKRITNIDPLTINTTALLGSPESAFQFIDKDGVNSSSQGYLLYDEGGRLYGSEDYDLIMVFPGSLGRGSIGPSWLDLGGRGCQRVSTYPSAGGYFLVWLKHSLPKRNRTYLRIVASPSTKNPRARFSYQKENSPSISPVSFCAN